MTILNEWANKNFPLANATGMRNMAALAVPPAATFISLGALFGGMASGSAARFLTIKADMATGIGKFYISLAPNGGTGMVNPNQSGSLPGVCWPLSDGQEIRARLVSHEVRATGIATRMGYPFLHYRSGGGPGQPNAPTGMLRLYISSTPEGGTQNFFPAP